MPKDTKTLGNSKARACESLGFVHKKGCARVLTHLLIFLGIFLFLYSLHSTSLCFKLFIDRYFRVVWAAMEA